MKPIFFLSFNFLPQFLLALWKNCEASQSYFPASNYMFKVNHRNSRTRCEICSKLTIKVPERCQFCRLGWNLPNYLTTWKLFFSFFFLIRVYSMQGWTATTRHGVARKRSTKRSKHTGNLFRKNLQLIDVC